MSCGGDWETFLLLTGMKLLVDVIHPQIIHEGDATRT
jgi:hypothetical protein